MKKIIIVICILFLCGCNKIKVKDNEDIYLMYVNENKNIKQKLTSNETKQIKKIIDNKKMYNDNPSCGFDKNVSFILEGLTFSIACDSCGIIKIEEKKKYLKLLDEEREKIDEIFEKYGGSFPCY